MLVKVSHHVIKFSVYNSRQATNSIFRIKFAVYRKLAESVSFCMRKVDFPELR